MCVVGEVKFDGVVEAVKGMKEKSLELVIPVGLIIIRPAGKIMNLMIGGTGQHLGEQLGAVPTSRSIVRQKTVLRHELIEGSVSIINVLLLLAQLNRKTGGLSRKTGDL